MAMQGQVDEVNSSKHLQMSYLEFLEGIARIADIVCFDTPTEDYKMKYQTILEKKKGMNNNLSIKKNDNSSIEENISDSDKISDEEPNQSFDKDEENLTQLSLSKKIDNILPNLLLN